MPLLTTGQRTVTPLVDLPIELLSIGASGAMWTSPIGEQWNLTDDPHGAGVITLPGVAGLEAAPRITVRRPLATGGTEPRWSHVAERVITWPVLVAADGDPLGFLSLRRRFVRAFTSTTPPAGIPSEGKLRIIRPDGSWREISALYETGLQGTDEQGMGRDKAISVISLVAPDPWWYGPEQIAIEFAYTEARAYVGNTGGASGTDPYETVSPSNSTGASDIHVEGDVSAKPVWTLTGPATAITVAIPGASFTYETALEAGEQVIVSVPDLTVATPGGVNMIGSLDWPSNADLFELPTGDLTVDITITGAGPGASVQLVYQPRYEAA